MEDLEGRVDFAAAIHLIHEVPDQDRFFQDVRQALKPGALLLAIEPKGHVKLKDFEAILEAAQRAGFELDQGRSDINARKALFINS